MIKVFISVVLLNAIASADVFSQWESFKKTYGKNYNVSVEAHRFVAFKENLELIKNHNNEADMGYHSFRLGVNQYADLDRYTFKDTVLTSLRATKRVLKVGKLNLTASLPDSIDWRSKGCVGPIRDQQQMGSASLFATVDALEGQGCSQANKSLVDLSIQQLTDCCPYSLTSQPPDFFQCVTQMGGIDDMGCYKYEETTQNPTTCKFDPACVVIKTSGFVTVQSGNELALKQTVAIKGPVAVGIDASQFSFQLYASGIYDDPLCTDVIDHFALIVGYGSETGQDYWLVKNSWGPDWGENGYIRMARNKDNLCGIASSASYPIIKK